MKQCNYSEFFPDEDSPTKKFFECTNEVHRSKKCKFHYKDYLKKSTREEIIQLFMDKLKEAKKKNTPLECVGYILPSISLIEDGEKILDIPIYFAHAKFKENVNFSNITFKKHVSFHKTIFSKSTKIGIVIFEKFVDFSFAEFCDNCNSFRYTKFNGFSDFKNVVIKNLDLEWANFKKVVFLDCKFYRDTNLSNIQFFGNSEFIKTKFFGETTFTNSTFHSNVTFEGAKFKEHINFSDVIFLKDENIIFNSNISNISFLNTDLKKIKFGNEISWKVSDSNENKRKNQYAEKRKNQDFKIYEERLLEKSDDTDINLESIKNIYRDLRENFDMSLQYDTAGEFFIREMELNRKYEKIYKNEKLITTKKYWWYRGFSPYWIYNILSQYGQSIRRPIYFAVPLIILGTFVFIDECAQLTTPSLNFPCDAPVYGSIIRSLSAFIPFFTFTEAPSIMDYVLRLALLPISGTFFISIKRKFERKLRH